MRSELSPKALRPAFSVASALFVLQVFLLSACTTALPVRATPIDNPGVPAHQEEPVLAIVNGRLFDGTGNEVLPDGAVVIRGNRIVAVGMESQILIPTDAERIDAGGGLIMPGIIDNHVHVFPTLSPRMGRGEDILTPWLQAGVTTLVDTGSIRHTLRASRAQASSMESPPRLLLAGPILTVPGGYPTTRREADAAMIAWEVEGPDDAYEVVAQLIDQEGADLIKVAIETGFQTDYGEEGWPTLSMEELRAIARAAHERDVLVRAHVSNPGELRAAMEAGLDILAHTPIHQVEDQLLDEAKEAGLIFISTSNIWGSRSAVAASNLYRYHQRGGMVVLGTDYPYQRDVFMPVPEMQLLISAGFTPAQVLLAATRDSAVAIGRGDELGTLEVGKLADVIVVGGDPLEDISDMKRIRVVILDGEVVVR